MIKAVLDTNIHISAFIKYGGKEWRILEKAVNQEITLSTSEDLLDEFRKVMIKPKFRYNTNQINEMIHLLLAISHLTTPEKKITAIKEDPADNKILECAKAGKADYIVSGDKHLLNLKEYDGIKILTSTEFLKITEKQ
ncbi:MAG: putative toxin-antitoxin system toxin component, PIN family [Candidatus Altiarchaeota archaeon]|nr:putative toxin-antitoxin system toxin component, PIN family [Candidatus Altiarchaeota archaeon]